jgi:hypothetical protein
MLSAFLGPIYLEYAFTNHRIWYIRHWCRWSTASIFIILPARDFSLSCSRILLPVFRPFLTGFDKSGWPTIPAGSSTLLLLRRSLSAQSSSFFTNRGWALSCCMEWGCPSNLVTFRLSERFCISLKITSRAIYSIRCCLLHLLLVICYIAGTKKEFYIENGLRCSWLKCTWRFYWSSLAN